jgi:hypothetical protein
MERTEVEQIDLTKEVQFSPTAIHLRTRRDCSIAVLHLWKYAMKDLDVSQVFYIVDQWAQIQSEREECMKLIMTTLIQKYCPHYTFTCVENDPIYQQHLKEHREMYELSQMISSEISGDDERGSVFGERRVRR